MSMVAKGFGDHTALIGNGRRRTYKELTDWTNRIAHVLVDDLGVETGQSRIDSLRPTTPPWWPAGWRQAKVGAVVVNTMPMLQRW